MTYVALFVVLVAAACAAAGARGAGWYARQALASVALLVLVAVLLAEGVGCLLHLPTVCVAMAFYAVRPDVR